MTEFRSRRELREAERQGLVPKPEQVFDLPTGQIKLPESLEGSSTSEAQDVASVNEMLTRKRIREMERLGLLDPLTGAVQVPLAQEVESRPFDSVIAEAEEPITSSISLANSPLNPPASTSAVPPVAPPVAQARAVAQPVAPTDIFHEMAVDLNARKPRAGIIIAVILLVLAGLGAAAYMLVIFK